MFLRHRPGLADERGSALIAVIGVMAVAAIIGAALVATTVFSAGFTSAARASVQAQAAAEGGIDAVASVLSTCASATYTNPPGTTPAFSAQVSYRTTPTGTWVVGCPTATATSVRIVSTGYAEATGVAGQSSGDVATMEAVLTPVVTVAGPEFENAIMGEKVISSVTSLTLSSAAGTPDMVTKGNFNCNTAMATSGRLWVGGNFTGTSGCNTGADVYVKGTYYCSDGMVVGGDLIVEGTVTLQSGTCRVNGKLWTGGDLATPSNVTVGGDLWVKGNMTGSGIAASGGTSVRVGGSVLGNAGKRASYGTRITQPDPALTAPNVSTVYDPADPANAFPRLTKTDARWATFTATNWRATTEAIRPESWINVCDIQGGVWGTPLTITTNTSFDTTATGQCPSGLSIGGGGFRIVLKADLVIFANGFQQNGNITVTSGDGLEHSLYIVQPWPATQTQCPASPGSPRITLTSGAWSQPDDKVRVLLYSPTIVNITTTGRLRGQIYGCRVTVQTMTEITFAPVGAVGGGGGGTPSYTTTSLRDVTG